MNRVRKIIPFAIKDLDEQDRSFTAIGSTEDIDRDNDRIMASGWVLDNFRKNPVVPWSHDYRQPPVAQAKAIWVEENRLLFQPKFPKAEEYSFGHTIWKLYQGGYLRSFSVGANPLRYEVVERAKGVRGFDYLEMDLWEISACTVPANPNALVAAKTAGVLDEDTYRMLTADPAGDFAAKAAEILTRMDNLEAAAEKLAALAGKIEKSGLLVNREHKPAEGALKEKTETPAQDVDRVAGIVTEAIRRELPGRIGEIIDKRVKLHLGIVD